MPWAAAQTLNASWSAPWRRRTLAVNRRYLKLGWHPIGTAVGNTGRGRACAFRQPGQGRSIMVSVVFHQSDQRQRDQGRRRERPRAGR